MLQPDRDEVEKLIAERISGIRVGASNLGGSFRNRAFANINPGNAGLPTAPSTGAEIIVGCALVNVLGSGIFQASVNYTITGATPTDTVITYVSTQATAALNGMTLSAAAVKVGPGYAGAGATNGAYTSNAAAGIVVTGGSTPEVQYGSGTYVFGTGASTATFGWSDVIMSNNVSTSETPFTRGNQVLLSLALNLSGGTVVFQSFGISLVELP